MTTAIYYLIIFTWTSSPYGGLNTHHLEFSSLAACQAAGSVADRSMERYVNRHVTYVCVRKD